MQAPQCLQQPDLDSALEVALSSPLEDIKSNASLTSEHIKTLKELGGLIHQGRDLYEEIKSVRILLCLIEIVEGDIPTVYEANYSTNL